MKEHQTQIRNKIFERDKNTCQKCNYIDETREQIEIHHIKPRHKGGQDEETNLIVLCSICHNYAPDTEREFKKYIQEKVDSKQLDTFRNSKRSIAQKTKHGMIKKLKKGQFMNRPPKGYKIYEKKLIIDENEKETIKELFRDFIEKKYSLNKLAKKYEFSVGGIKKILMNKTYIGHTKFGKESIENSHKAIIEKEIFNKAQERLAQKTKHTPIISKELSDMAF